MSSEAVKAGYTMTEVGVIPEDWELDKIKNIAQITTGNRNTQDRKDDGSYPFFVRSATVEKINSYSYDGEAVLTAGDGVGTGKIYHYIDGKFDFHQRVYKISEFSPDINGYFFFLYFSNNFYNRIISMTAKSSVDSVRLEMIANMSIPLPPLPEQIAIAAALSDTDALIASLEKLIAKKKEIKQAAMQELLTGKKRLPGFGDGKGYKQTEVGFIPEDWEVKPIVDHIDLLTGFPFSSSQYSNSGTRLLRGSNIKRGKIDWSEEITEYWSQVTPELKKYLLLEGDLVISMDGSLVGRSYSRLTKKDVPSLLLQRVARIRSKKIDIGYLKQFVGSDNFVKYSDSVKTVTAIPHISPDNIRNFTIPIPPSIKEQTAIASILSDMDDEIAGLEQKRDKVLRIKEGMMQELLTGRIRLV